MTTVAWDGKILAADTQLVSSGWKVSTIKLWKLDDGSICGGCGEYYVMAKLVTWLNSGGGPISPVEFGPDDSADLLVVKPDRSIWIVEQHGVFIPITAPPLAIGSGAVFAMGAMEHGKDAIDAVKYASTRDPMTGSEVQYLCLDKPRKNR